MREKEREKEMNNIFAVYLFYDQVFYAVLLSFEGWLILSGINLRLLIK
jgi:hypothetical protein